jgi:beta-phosphoglucomutase-like phosphatase (HAD superfamily)
MSIDTVIFDLDGVIIDTEDVWNSVRQEFTLAHGGHWTREIDQPKVMGANSMQWAASLRENNGVDLSDEEIYEGIIGGLKERYAQHLPIVAGAPAATERLAEDYCLGVASSSPREIIEYALELAEIRARFAAVVSSDEVARGKPEPDVYLEACRRLGALREQTAAVEDSSSGLMSAHAAGLTVIAIPNPAFPPSAEAVARADVVLGSIKELDGGILASLGRAPGTAAKKTDDLP